MGKKITQYTAVTSTNPDTGSLLDVSEKSGSTYATKKWSLLQVKTWLATYLQLPFSSITSTPTTISGYGITDAVDTTGGTTNYISKFTDANTIEESQIQDDGTTIGIGTAPNPNNFVLISNTIKSVGLLAQTSFNSGIGFYGQALSGTGSLIGVFGLSNSATATTNTGIHGKAMNTGATNIGVTGEAIGGTNNYCAKLTDGTEASGKFLKSVTADGKANWANITASDISGIVDTTGGTTNYISKFIDANTIEESLIQDDGDSISINSTPDSTMQFKVETTKQYAIHTTQTRTSGNNYGYKSISNGSGATTNIGVAGEASGSTQQNTGVIGQAIGTASINIGAYGVCSGGTLNIAVSGASNGATGTNIGISGYAVNGTANYCAKLTDGTEATGKILKSATADGKANWAYFPCEVQLAVSDETTALTTGAGKITFRMPYAMVLQEVRASLVVAGTTSGLTTIDINESGATILSTKLTIDLTEKTSTTASTPAVISDTALADDAEITIDIDAISGGATEKGLKVLLKGYRLL